MNRYFGQVALVTGASRGIGLAIAKRILSEGGKVVITARKPEALELAILELGGPEFALAVIGSADDPDHQDETVRRAIETFGRIDVLVNNCGINPHYGRLLDVDYSAAKEIFDVNVMATISWTKKVADAWLGKHGGAVVNVASLAGIKPETGIGMYGVSKAALLQVTRQLAVELGPKIRVNAVAPAVVKTKFAEKKFEGKETELSKRYAVGRLGEPEDVAAAVAFLGSPDAAWITGQILTLDGGVTLTGGF
jgi:3-oxoacyl-[acyl-carrier protein] reductase